MPYRQSEAQRRQRIREELAVLRMIEIRVREGDPAPSRRDMLGVIGRSSPDSAQAVVRRLAAKGLVQVTPGVDHGVSITASGMAALAETM